MSSHLVSVHYRAEAELGHFPGWSVVGFLLSSLGLGQQLLTVQHRGMAEAELDSCLRLESDVDGREVQCT